MRPSWSTYQPESSDARPFVEKRCNTPSASIRSGTGRPAPAMALWNWSIALEATVGVLGRVARRFAALLRGLALPAGAHGARRYDGIGDDLQLLTLGAFAVGVGVELHSADDAQ